MQDVRKTPAEVVEPEAPKFLSSADVSRLLGIHQATVLRWARDGLIPAWKTPGGTFRFRPADVDKLVAEAHGTEAAS